MDKKLPPIIYYSDELTDEFSTAQITPIKIDASYDYGNNSFGWRIKHFFWYRIVATPIAWFFLKFKYAHKIIGRKKIRPYKKGSFYIFGNHTNAIADALIPTFVSWPKHTYVIVHANNVSIPGMGQVTKYMGAIPLPDDMAATKNFLNTVKLRTETAKSLTIYPEAHIWPFCTWIRNFPDTSFRYPVQYKTPVFCFTNTYQKRRFSKNPRIVTYVDGPFYADESLSQKDKRAALRNMVYNAMVERSRMNNCELIKYIKKEENSSIADSAKLDETEKTTEEK